MSVNEKKKRKDFAALKIANDALADALGRAGNFSDTSNDMSDGANDADITYHDALDEHSEGGA